MAVKLVGVVVGTAMRKTVKVLMQYRRQHVHMTKMTCRRKIHFAHDEHELGVIGDVVMIEALPYNISNQKHFKLCRIVKEAQRYIDPETGDMFTAPPSIGSMMDPAKFEEEYN